MDISESPHDKFHFYIEMAWICSTGFGIILFLVEIGKNVNLHSNVDIFII